MEEEKKHIDQLFSDALKAHEANPPGGTWERIENSLWQQRYYHFRQKVLQIAAVAVILISLGGGYLFYYLRNEIVPQESPMALETHNTQQDIYLADSVADAPPAPGKTATQPLAATGELAQNNPKTVKQQKDVQNPTAGAQQANVKVIHQMHSDEVLNLEVNQVSSGAEFSSESAVENQIEATLPVLASRQALTFASSTGITEQYPVNHPKRQREDLNTFAGTHTQFSTEELADKFNGKSEWQLGGQLTPLYAYRTISKAGAMPGNTTWYNENETPLYTYAGGVNVNYSSGSRFSIRTGVYYIKLGQGIDNVQTYSNDLAFNTDFKAGKSTIAVANSVGNINNKNTGAGISELQAQPGTAVTVTNEVASVRLGTGLGNLRIEQTFEYLEVPLLIEYKLIDRTIDMHFVSGVSANFLVGNQVDALDGGERFTIGETENLSQVNYSGTLGLGFAYELARHLSVSIEPNFRYYFNPVNTSGLFDHHPYAFGLSTGINFMF